MTIIRTIENNKTIFSVNGRIDTSTAPELSEEISGLNESDNLIIDFREVEYISSAGLRVLLKAQKELSKSGSFSVRNLSESVMDIFKITGFCDIITIE